MSVQVMPGVKGPMTRRMFARDTAAQSGHETTSKARENKAIVGRWFTEFWGNPWNPGIVDALAAPDMLLQYSLHAPRRGRELAGGAILRPGAVGDLPHAAPIPPRAIISSSRS